MRLIPKDSDVEYTRIGRLMENFQENEKKIQTTAGVVTQLYAGYNRATNKLVWELQIDDGLQSCVFFVPSQMAKEINLGSVVCAELKYQRNAMQAIKLTVLGQLETQDMAATNH